MNSQELSERMWAFAARIAKVIDALPDTRMGRHIAGQLCRCGTSSPPNYDEACAAESRADFVHKLHVAWKELRETRGWLRFIVRLDLLNETRIAPLVAESEELSKILASSLKTAKSRARPAAPSTKSQMPNAQSSMLNSASEPVPRR